MKFRVWDSADNKYVNDRFIVWSDEGKLYVVPYFYSLHNQCIIELNTGFVDSEGKEIFQNDKIHVLHTGQDSACMKSEGYDYHVDWNQDKGQWAIYSYDLGFKMFYAPLYLYATKGIITGRHNKITT